MKRFFTIALLALAGITANAQYISVAYTQIEKKPEHIITLGGSFGEAHPLGISVGYDYRPTPLWMVGAQIGYDKFEDYYNYYGPAEDKGISVLAHARRNGSSRYNTPFIEAVAGYGAFGITYGAGIGYTLQFTREIGLDLALSYIVPTEFEESFVGISVKASFGFDIQKKIAPSVDNRQVVEAKQAAKPTATAPKQPTSPSKPSTTAAKSPSATAKPESAPKTTSTTPDSYQAIIQRAADSWSVLFPISNGDNPVPPHIKAIVADYSKTIDQLVENLPSKAEKSIAEDHINNLQLLATNLDMPTVSSAAKSFTKRLKVVVNSLQ